MSCQLLYQMSKRRKGKGIRYKGKGKGLNTYLTIIKTNCSRAGRSMIINLPHKTQKFT